MDVQSAKLFAAALAVLPLFGVGLSLGNLFSSALSSISRNPSVADTIKGTSLLYFALVEALALFALVVALIILFVF